MAKGKYQEWLTPDSLLLLEGWARDGLTDDDIANNIGITRSTFYEWCKKYSDFSDAIKKGKGPADYKVENAMFRSATGYKETLRKPMKLRLETGEEIVEYVEEEIYVAPAVSAQIFWLKNRRPGKWRDKQEEVKSDNNELLQSLMDLEKKRNDNMGE